MKYELFVGLRYLRARRRETFISLLSMISILGVTIAVLTLNVVIGVMTGFEEVLRDRLLGINSHVVLVKVGGTMEKYNELTERVLREEGVLSAAPMVYGQVILSTGDRISGVVVRGVDPDRANGVVAVERYMEAGTLKDLKQHRTVTVKGRTLKLPGIILGTRLAAGLGVLPGEPIQLVSPLGKPTAVGMVPKIRRFVVVGLFKSGMHEYDSSLVFMDINDAQRFFGLGDSVTSIEIRVHDVDEAQGVAQKIQRTFGLPYLAEDWSRLWPNLFAALRLERWVYILVLLLMVMIAAFNIISTLIMVVMEKRRDIAVLRSMGASRGSVWRIFLLKGCIIGVVGTFLGSGLGYVLCLLIQEYQFIELPKDVFLVSTVPVKISGLYFALVSLVSLLICLLASIYPARQAAKLDPVEIIRYE